MIHGDFQEEVEVKEPEYVVETVSKRVYDTEKKQVKDVKVRYRYRVIRYFDARERVQGAVLEGVFET
jgi:hypothetical protein